MFPRHTGNVPRDVFVLERLYSRQRLKDKRDSLANSRVSKSLWAKLDPLPGGLRYSLIHYRKDLELPVRVGPRASLNA
jgi:hypothetical protein